MTAAMIELSSWDGPAFGDGPAQPSAPSLRFLGVQRTEAVIGRIREDWARLLDGQASILWGQVTLELLTRSLQAGLVAVTVEVYARGQELASRGTGPVDGLLGCIDQAFSGVRAQLKEPAPSFAGQLQG
jgi:hypothetical protein